MTDNYIHLGDFENFARNRFKNIVDGKGPIIPRIAVKIALDDIFKEDAVLTNAMHSDDESWCVRCGDSFDDHCKINHPCAGYKARRR